MFTYGTPDTQQPHHHHPACVCFKKKKEGAETVHMCVHAGKHLCARESKKEGERGRHQNECSCWGFLYIFFFLLLARGFSPGGVSSYLIDAQRLRVRYHKPGELPAAAPRRQRV